MSLLRAILLGFIQGITEFLPVSSHGHLVLLQQMFMIDMDTGILFEMLLHMGSTIAIIIIFRNDFLQVCSSFRQMMSDIFYNMKARIYNYFHEFETVQYQTIMSDNYRKFTGMLLTSVGSCAVVASIFRELSITIGDSLLAVGLNFLVIAVLLLVVDLWKYGTTVPKDMKFWQAALIGVAHGVGIFPGISRLGVTISICLLCGLRKKFAVRYAFLLSIPTSIGAMLLELDEFISPGMTLQLGAIYFAGMIVTLVISLLCARFMLKLITKIRYRIFAIYSMIIGIVAIIYNFM